jgi:hypothetical protein
MAAGEVTRDFDDRLGSYACRLAAGLIDPDCPIPDGVLGPSGKGAIKRYNIYRNNVTVSLIDALAAVFPATQRITGVEFFRAMARFHVRTTPPRSPLLFQYGHEFPDFIERYEYAREMPYLADTARVERAWLDAYHSADISPLSAQDLAAIPADRLEQATFVPHPSTRIVRSRYPAVTIFATNRNEGPVERIDNFVAEDALITRPDVDVTVCRLPAGGAAFLVALLAGQTLGDAAALAVETTPEFDLTRNIAGMLEAGVFAAVHDGEKP